LAKRKVKKKRSVKKKSTRSSSTVIKIPQVPIRQRLDPFALAYSLAILRATLVLLISIVKAPNLIKFVESIHFTYSASLSGVITGVAETAIWGLVMGFLIGWLYNKFV
tara:strand:+ start:16 stop:339 length:324 start_codon:yes stop_codon:yes gene_type:complete